MRDICGAVKDQVDIVSYARDIGYTVIRKGNYYSLKEHDSVMIDPQKNCYWRNSKPGNGSNISMGGSVIDFAMEFQGVSLDEALWVLGNRINFNSSSRSVTPVQKRQNEPESKTPQLPPKGQNMHKVFAYLIKTRGIAAEIVQELVKRKQLYQDNHGNCVFVSYDKKGQIVFACRRGTNTYVPFYGDVPGSDYSRGFCLDHQADKVYVTESVIDALSVMTLKGKDARQWNYLVLNGVGKWQTICTYLEDKRICSVWIGLDNDDPGAAAGIMLARKVKEIRPGIEVFFDFPPGKEGKDWNEVLVERRRSK
ncbi:MAG: DUF3991 and toprim domain-containing protein [Lachnospiraceae bacterium]|nr:DUF3991 and toprim domain-containing protein [Lachnospiraceae bacterium]